MSSNDCSMAVCYKAIRWLCSCYRVVIYNFRSILVIVTVFGCLFLELLVCDSSATQVYPRTVRIMLMRGPYLRTQSFSTRSWGEGMRADAVSLQGRTTQAPTNYLSTQIRYFASPLYLYA